MVSVFRITLLLAEDVEVEVALDSVEIEELLELDDEVEAELEAAVEEGGLEVVEELCDEEIELTRGRSEGCCRRRRGGR